METKDFIIAKRKKFYTSLSIMAGVYVLPLIITIFGVLGTFWWEIFNKTASVAGMFTAIALFALIMGIAQCTESRKNLRIASYSYWMYLLLYLLRLVGNDKAMRVTTVMIFVFDIIIMYFLTKGAAGLMDEYDKVLAVKLNALFKFYAIAWCVTFLTAFLTLATNSYIFLVLAVLGKIGTMAVDVVKIVLLAKCSKVFK